MGVAGISANVKAGAETEAIALRLRELIGTWITDE
jgi:hypothetical protein